MQQPALRRSLKIHSTTSTTTKPQCWPHDHTRSGSPHLPNQGPPRSHCGDLRDQTPEPDILPEKPVGKKPTRTSVIAGLLQVQQQHSVTPDEHAFQESKGYLKCSKCNLAVRKRANEDTFRSFVEGPCIDAAYRHQHQGHHTHTLWQRGKKIKCKGCGLRSHLDDEERLILTKGLKKECRGMSQSSPTLDQLFGAQAKSKQSPVGHDTQPAPETPPGQSTAAASLSPPAPKKLKFNPLQSGATLTIRLRGGKSRNRLPDRGNG